MKIRLLLAHAAEVQNSLLFAMGVGWTEIGPAPSAFAIAAILEVGCLEGLARELTNGLAVIVDLGAKNIRCVGRQVL